MPETTAAFLISPTQRLLTATCCCSVVVTIYLNIASASSSPKNMFAWRLNETGSSDWRENFFAYSQSQRPVSMWCYWRGLESLIWIMLNYPLYCSSNGRSWFSVLRLIVILATGNADASPADFFHRLLQGLREPLSGQPLSLLPQLFQLRAGSNCCSRRAKRQLFILAKNRSMPPLA